MPKRILIVEDFLDTRELFAEALRMEGYTVDEAGDGEAAFACAAEATYHLVLMDIGLPRMDGIEVSRQLRSRGLLRDARILVVSAYVGENALQVAERAGAVRALPKPTTPDELVTEVQAIIGTP